MKFTDPFLRRDVVEDASDDDADMEDDEDIDMNEEFQAADVTTEGDQQLQVQNDEVLEDQYEEVEEQEEEENDDSHLDDDLRRLDDAIDSLRNFDPRVDRSSEEEEDEQENEQENDEDDEGVM